jgi:hypothetical protein
VIDSVKASATPKAAPATGFDAVAALTVFLVLLFAIPSRLIFAPLGGAGTPAQVIGLVILAWWLAHRLALSKTHSRAGQPVRRAMLLFLAAVLASYIVATSRPITGAEMRTANMGILGLLAAFGVMSLAIDGIPSMDRLHVLMRRVVVGGGALAGLGILQFATGMSFTDYISIPGLTPNASIDGVIERNGFSRPAGTATHPIEFGVVLTMILPFALHYALADSDRSRTRRWFPVLAIATAVPISLSRSALVGAIVVLALLLPTWPRARRRTSYLVVAILCAILYVSVPGFLGTLTRLFTGISNDGSALSRTDSYTLAAQFIGRSPLFGRGFSTFLPEYRILDNQYLGLMIETGFVGLAAILGLFITGIATAHRVRRLSPDPATRQLAQCLAASIASGACSFATFDAFGFPMVNSLMFLLLGIAGALMRLTTKSAIT